MIEYRRTYVSGTQCFATLPEAQLAELVDLMTPMPVDAQDCARLLLERRKTIVDVLTMTSESRPRARSSNGGKKNRKRTDPAQDAIPGLEVPAAAAA